MQAAVGGDLAVGVVPLLIGIVLVALLGFVLIAYGRRRRAREPLPPRSPQPRSGAWHTREEYGRPTPPDHGPGHQDGTPSGYEEASRPAEEVPRDGGRLRPYDIRDYPGPRT